MEVLLKMKTEIRSDLVLEYKIKKRKAKKNEEIDSTNENYEEYWIDLGGEG